MRKCWVANLRQQLACRLEGEHFRLAPPARSQTSSWQDRSPTQDDEGCNEIVDTLARLCLAVEVSTESNIEGM
ncbi:hypothetical protein PybrP1_010586 [[Pythium] brassicae (nom. inval.)]|nr:hypothetical protein PybrP1_010586 [[Pythium] brassicae (nom. inval.)]